LQNKVPEAQKDNDVYVIVEIRVKRGHKLTTASDIPKEIKLNGLRIDETLRPLPMSPRREQATINTNEEKGVIIRGVIKENKIRELEAIPEVIKVSRDSKVEPFSCPIPPCDCTYMTPKGDISQVAQYLGVDQIWAKNIRGQGIVIGIVDCGINALGRPQKAGETAKISHVIDGYPSDWGTTSAAWNEHGNMTATDALGMAPLAQLYDVRITGPGNIEQMLGRAMDGYQWAIDMHKSNGTPHILSNSWGLYQKIWDVDYATDVTHPFTQKVVEALDEGIIVLFAAGNCGSACPDFRCSNIETGVNDVGPGKDIWGANGYHNVMTVGAANRNGQFVGYSSMGPAALDPIKPDFCSITHFTGYKTSDNGTSAATPIAAGVVALLKNGSLNLTQDLIKQALKQTATDIGPSGWDNYSGSGIINAINAWNWLFVDISPHPPTGLHPISVPKFKAIDDGVKPIGDVIKLPGEIAISPAIRGLSRSASANVPFVLATPHHSVEWVKRNSTSYLASYEEILSEYELAITNLEEQLKYLRKEYVLIREDHENRSYGLRR